MNTQPSKETRVATEAEWSQAWEAFNSAVRQLHKLADMDGHLLKVDFTFKAGGNRKVVQ